MRKTKGLGKESAKPAADTSTGAAPEATAASDRESPGVVAPAVIPLLDLLAEVIAEQLWRESSVTTPNNLHPVATCDPDTRSELAGPSTTEQPGTLGPIPTFP